MEWRDIRELESYKQATSETKREIQEDFIRNYVSSHGLKGDLAEEAEREFWEARKSDAPSPAGTQAELLADRRSRPRVEKAKSELDSALNTEVSLKEMLLPTPRKMSELLLPQLIITNRLFNPRQITNIKKFFPSWAKKNVFSGEAITKFVTGGHSSIEEWQDAAEAKRGLYESARLKKEMGIGLKAEEQTALNAGPYYRGKEKEDAVSVEQRAKQVLSDPMASPADIAWVRDNYEQIRSLGQSFMSGMKSSIPGEIIRHADIESMDEFKKRVVTEGGVPLPVKLSQSEKKSPMFREGTPGLVDKFAYGAGAMVGDIPALVGIGAVSKNPATVMAAVSGTHGVVRRATDSGIKRLEDARTQEEFDQYMNDWSGLGLEIAEGYAGGKAFQIAGKFASKVPVVEMAYNSKIAKLQKRKLPLGIERDQAALKAFLSAEKTGAFLKPAIEKVGAIGGGVAGMSATQELLHGDVKVEDVATMSLQFAFLEGVMGVGRLGASKTGKMWDNYVRASMRQSLAATQKLIELQRSGKEIDISKLSRVERKQYKNLQKTKKAFREADEAALEEFADTVDVISDTPGTMIVKDVKKGVPQSNIDAAEMLEEFSTLIQRGNRQRSFAYRKAAIEIANLKEDVSKMNVTELYKIKGVKEHVGKILQEFFKEGKVEDLENIRRNFSETTIESISEKASLLGLTERKVFDFMKTRSGQAELERLVQQKKIRQTLGVEPSSVETKYFQFTEAESPDGLPYRARLVKTDASGTEYNSHIVVSKEADGYSVRLATVGGRQSKRGRTTFTKTATLAEALKIAETRAREKIKKEGFSPYEKATKQEPPKEEAVVKERIIKEITEPVKEEMSSELGFTKEEMADISSGSLEKAAERVYSRLSKANEHPITEIRLDGERFLLRGSRKAMEEIFPEYVREYGERVSLFNTKGNGLDRFRFAGGRTDTTEESIKFHIKAIVDRASSDYVMSELSAMRKAGGDLAFEVAKKYVEQPEAPRYGRNVEEKANALRDAHKSGKGVNKATNEFFRAWKMWNEIPEGETPPNMIEFEGLRRRAARDGAAGLREEAPKAVESVEPPAPKPTEIEKAEHEATVKQVREVVEQKVIEAQETIADSIGVDWSMINFEGLNESMKRELRTRFREGHLTRLKYVAEMTEEQVATFIRDTMSRPDVTPEAQRKLIDEIIRIRKRNTEHGEAAKGEVEGLILDMSSEGIGEILNRFDTQPGYTVEMARSEIRSFADSVLRKVVYRFGEAVAMESEAGRVLTDTLHRGIKHAELLGGEYVSAFETLYGKMNPAEDYLLAKRVTMTAEEFKAFLRAKGDGVTVRVVIDGNPVDYPLSKIDFVKLERTAPQLRGLFNRVFVDMSDAGMTAPGGEAIHYVEKYMPSIIKDGALNNKFMKEELMQHVIKDMIARKIDISEYTQGKGLKDSDVLSSAKVRDGKVVVRDQKLFDELVGIAKQHLGRTAMSRGERRLGYQYKKVVQSQLPEYLEAAIYETSAKNICIKYFEEVGTRIAEVQHWGLGDGKLNDLVLGIAKEVSGKNRVDALEIVERAIRLVNASTWRNSVDNEMGKILRGILQTQVVLRMGLSAISQVPQAFSGIVVGNLDSWVKGLKWAMSGSRKPLGKVYSYAPGGRAIGPPDASAREFYVRTGAGLTMMRNDMIRWATGASKFTDKFLYYNGFKFMDHIARFQATSTGYFYGEWLADQLNSYLANIKYLKPDDMVEYLKASPKSAQIIDKMQKFDLDPQKIIARGKNEFGKYWLTGNEKLEMGRKFEVETNYRARPIDLPEAFTQSTWGRLVFQFRSYDYSKTIELKRHVVDYAMKGDFAPLLQLLAVGGIVGTPMRELRYVMKYGDHEKRGSEELLALLKGGEGMGKAAARLYYEGLAAAGYLAMFEMPLGLIATAANLAGVEGVQGYEAGRFGQPPTGAFGSSLTRGGQALRSAINRKHNKWAPLLRFAITDVSPLVGYALPGAAGPVASIAIGGRAQYLSKKVRDYTKEKDIYDTRVEKGWSPYKIKKAERAKARRERRRR